MVLFCHDGAAPLGAIIELLARTAAREHLDRIAVRPDLQGSGYGAATLAFTVETLFHRGSRRVGLSTQATNHRSRRLYERFGFRRTPGHDYDLYGSTRPRPSNWRTIELPWPPASR